MPSPGAAERARWINGSAEMRFEVELIKQDDGLYRATAVEYPTVSATGRTEKEALGLLMEAMGKHMKVEAARATRSPA